MVFIYNFRYLVSQPRVVHSNYLGTSDAYLKMSDIFGGITTCQVACYQPFAEHTLHAYVRNTSMENGGKRCQLNTPSETTNAHFQSILSLRTHAKWHPYFKRCHLVSENQPKNSPTSMCRKLLHAVP
ncbi:hypothetical protein ALC60_04989 [Trachymyrmex zeteki]|uniref:Uncharacterized protein n=1 Tax=Mycetomoellerius zeteki TaxID=64791 RepID=A0A151X6U3_9HYME|nr:hypothetical protein ALC60_04989 [Trachymyrmex zeteki]